MQSLYRICAEPLVFHAYNFDNIFAPVKYLEGYIGRNTKRMHVILTLNWSVLRNGRCERLAACWHRSARRHPWLSVTVLANQKEECDRLRQLGVDAELCNQNCLLDENRYTILPVEKTYDAVINSRMAPYKRIPLTAELGNCALVTYFLNGQDEAYGRSILPFGGRADAPCRNLLCPQFDGRAWRRFSADEVAECLNRSRCGLILSEEEGACFVAAEYLLCGLPVVTTRSIGGRDEFFDDDFVVYADPDPRSVRQAVEKALRITVPPEEIRARTVARMHRLRETYRAIVNRIRRSEGCTDDLRTEDFFTDKMMRMTDVQGMVRMLAENGIDVHKSALERMLDAHRAFKRMLKSLRRG